MYFNWGVFLNQFDNYWIKKVERKIDLEWESGGHKIKINYLKQKTKALSIVSSLFFCSITVHNNANK